MSKSLAELAHMEMMTLSLNEKQKIYDLVMEIKIECNMELDEMRMREDFYSLHYDISQKLKELCLNVDDFYELSELMKDVSKIITPYYAFAYGKVAKAENIDVHTSFSKFLTDASFQVNEHPATIERNSYLDAFLNAHIETGPLFEEFKDLYIKLDVINNNLEKIFMLGYNFIV